MEITENSNKDKNESKYNKANCGNSPTNVDPCPQNGTDKQIIDYKKWTETKLGAAVDNNTKNDSKLGDRKGSEDVSKSDVGKSNEQANTNKKRDVTNEKPKAETHKTQKIETQMKGTNKVFPKRNSIVNLGTVQEKQKLTKSNSFLRTKHTAKVVPDDTIDILEVENTTDVPLLLEKENKERDGSALLTAVRKRNKAEALNLLNLEEDIHYRDETKCNVLHYAALAGYDDLIIKLISLGADVKMLDCNGETPLHKAARAGHETTIVTLVSQGADVNTFNKNGKNALELAVRGKHVNVADVLCMFGVELVMQDWTWLEDVMDSKNKTDCKLREILIRQSDRAAGFTHGGITYNAIYINPGQNVKLDEVGVTVDAKECSSPFLFYCSKLQVEYVDFKRYIKEEEEIFSDAFECRTWGSSHKVYTLTFKIRGVPKCNETIKIVSPDGKMGRVNSTDRNKDEDFTEINITITIKPNKLSSFIFVTLEQPEVFSISKEAATIQSKIEPGMEIGIPEGAFDKPGDLIFNVVETEDVNEDDIDTSKETVLLTNVVDLSVNNHQQPKKPLDMQLPLRGRINNNSGVVILTTSKNYPESVDDWEIVEASRDGDTKRANFKIQHFSIFTGVVKKKVDQDLYEVTKLIQKALNNERQVEFFTMVKTISKNDFAVVFECSLQRKSKLRKRFWAKKDFDQQSVDAISYSSSVQVNSTFKITIEGNLRQTGCEESESQRLMFNPNRDNFLIFSVEAINTAESPQGRIKLDQITVMEQEPLKVVEAGAGCRGEKTTFIPRPPKEVCQELTALPLELIPAALPEEMVAVAKKDVRDLECAIKVLRIGSLMQLFKRLNKDEIYNLAVQLKVVTSSELADWAKAYPNTQQFMDVMFIKWRGLRPNATRIDFLVKALEGMGKECEALEVKMANIEKRTICFM